MKKYLFLIFLCIFLFFSFQYLNYYQQDLYIPTVGEITSITKVEGNNLYIDKGNGFEIFEMRGVNLGLGKPGEFATEFSITKKEYLKWFKEIQDLGANVIRTYTLAHQDFYDAFYEYNVNNPNPLYLIHGVWVDDYMLNSYRSAFEPDFYNDFLNSSKEIIDVIHGNHRSNDISKLPTQKYTKDISPWVFGYILGVEWEGELVTFTDNTLSQRPQFNGEYLYTKNASNFEIFLAEIGNQAIEYETQKYGEQRSVAFSNWPTTCPLEFSEKINQEFSKYGKIDVENILSTDRFIGGQYASYHVYPYYPEFIAYEDTHYENTYLEYLTRLKNHHSMPVIISEFGIPSSRGMASYEDNQLYGRNQGFMSEKAQGEAIVSLYKDIVDSGCAGGIVFIWQDEWFKRTWNTMGNIDLKKTAYWSDYQTNEQYFGLLSFDPGKEKSICYVDGDKSEWEEMDVVSESGDNRLSMKFDEKFIYFLAEKPNFDFKNDKIYIPIDITPKSGSNYSRNLNLNMDRKSDFIIEINNTESRIWVHERYDTTNAIYGRLIKKDYDPFSNPPDKDSEVFNNINLALQGYKYYRDNEEIEFTEFDLNEDNNYSLMQVYETGKLTYGNANPSSEDFNSLGDYFDGEGFVEIKIPWELLNFADPTSMKIHDDYYEKYGIEYIKISGMGIGIGSGRELIEMDTVGLDSLGRKPEYHERLKQSYYILQEYWKNN